MFTLTMEFMEWGEPRAEEEVAGEESEDEAAPSVAGEESKEETAPSVAEV